MYRGTTQVFKIVVLTKLDMSKIKQVYVTFANKTTQITKDITDVKIEPDKKTITVYLTQYDTLAFTPGSVKMQVRILLTDGSAHASNTKTIEVEKILRDGEIFVNEVY